MDCPFTGKKCPHEKPVHVTEVNGDVVNTFQVCTECPAVQPAPEIVPAAELTVESLLVPQLGLLQHFKDLFMPAEDPLKEIKCPKCGVNLREVVQTSKLGCAECYVAFAESIRPAVAAVQDGNQKHKGKKPKSSLLELQKRLAEAIKAEKYEEAAKLRDQIKAIQPPPS